MLHCSVREAQQRIDSREFVQWIALYNIEPWGEVRNDFMVAQLCAIMVNAWRGKGSKAVQAADFMPRFDRPTKTTTTKGIMGYFKALAHGLSKRGNRDRKS